MNNIKAITTRYQGCRFRSRLEARWAVFLDSLGIVWQYEKQGYKLGRLGCYLPDFWIPYPYGDGWGEWLEIKPTAPTEEEQAKLAALVRRTGHRAYCLAGEPWPDRHRVYVWQHHHSGVVGRIPLIVGGELKEVNHGNREIGPIISIRVSDGPAEFHFPGGNGKEPGALHAAFTAARSARFEFGESGGRPA